MTELRVGISATSLNTAHLRGMGKYLLEMCSQARPEDGVAWTLFAQDALDELTPLFARITSTDAVPHPSNRIGLAPLFADALLRGVRDARMQDQDRGTA